MQYEKEKMKRLVAQDHLLKFVFQDLMKREHSEDSALEVVFNSYVLDDSSMEDEYNKA